MKDGRRRQITGGIAGPLGACFWAAAMVGSQRRCSSRRVRRARVIICFAGASEA